MKELVAKDNDNEIVSMPDVDFFEMVDRVMGAYLNRGKFIRLTERDYSFAKDLLDIHHILVSPDVLRTREISLICNLVKCSKPKAKRLRIAHELLWGDAKGANDDFQKRLIADKILKFAEDAESDGDNNKAAEFYKDYYLMRGFDKIETNKVARALPKLIVLSSDKKLLEIEDAEYE